MNHWGENIDDVANLRAIMNALIDRINEVTPSHRCIERQLREAR